MVRIWPACEWTKSDHPTGEVRKCDHPRVHVPGRLVTHDLCEGCDQQKTRPITGMPEAELAGQQDHEQSHQIREWAVGVTTAPRNPETLTRTLVSLQEAGWDLPRLFAEPGAIVPTEFSGLPISQRDETLGAFPNWWLGLAELVLRAPRAEAYFICQDDVLFSSSLRAYLERNLWPAVNIGVVSIYCPSHIGEGLSDGFHPVNEGWNTWGALAYVFPNPSARALLSDPNVLGHRHHGPAEGLRNVDSIVGNWCDRTGRSYFVHTPSLAQHIGDVSTLWKHASNSGRRRAATFSPSFTADFVAGKLRGGKTH